MTGNQFRVDIRQQKKNVYHVILNDMVNGNIARIEGFIAIFSDKNSVQYVPDDDSSTLPHLEEASWNNLKCIVQSYHQGIEQLGFCAWVNLESKE